MHTVIFVLTVTALTATIIAGYNLCTTFHSTQIMVDEVHDVITDLRPIIKSTLEDVHDVIDEDVRGLLKRSNKTVHNLNDIVDVIEMKPIARGVKKVAKMSCMSCMSCMPFMTFLGKHKNKNKNKSKDKVSEDD